ncbi:MAG: hypothetical protein AMS22_05750 [Thiotrichales bacterium SG8_50]|jgi:hypothetical protein|nr:MAG: hypothetical protein AMS22_05750 [Thiotrichales bacterium SG8_50]
MPVRTRGKLKTIIIVTAGILLAACDPGVYRKPVQDFRSANEELRRAYFLQLEITRDAMLTHFSVQRKRSLWGNPNLKGDPEAAQRVADAIAKERERALLNKDLVALRNRAFDTIDAYAGVLLALASDEDTNAIAADLQGLVGDLQQFLGVAKEVQGVSDLATKGAAWIGPLGAAVSAFNEIVKLVSAVTRSVAIRDTIVTADPAIQELLVVLGEEAAYARTEAKSKYAAAEQALQKQLKAGVVDDAAAREISEVLALVAAKANRLEGADGLKEVFESARIAQAGLVRRAAKPDYNELLGQVRAFKVQVIAVRQSLEALRDER